MATFNIDFNQFKPSSRGGQALPSSSPTPVSAPTMPKPLPRPVQTTTQPSTQPSKGKFFSGNLWNKALDIPMLPQYAIAGFQKGAWESLDKQKAAGQGINRGTQFKDALKGIVTGVQNRASFGTQPEDINAAERLGVKNKGWQSAANFGLSLAAPSLSVSKVFKGISKLPGVSQVLSGANKVKNIATNYAKATPALYKTIEKVNPYFRRPEVGNIVRGAEEAATGRISKTFDDIKKLATGLTGEEQIVVGQLIEGKIKKAAPNLMAIAKQAQKMGSDVGSELIKEGLLPKNTKLGKYLPHIFETASREMAPTKKALPGFVGKFFKKRTGAEGYLPEFAPSLFKGLGTEVKDIEVNKLFKKLATDYGTKVTKKANVPAGMVWAKDIVKNPQLQKLFKRTAIPTDVAEYMARIYDVPKKTGLDKATNIWKAAKTIYNPAYHARNLVSNQILTGMGTGRGVVRTAYDTIKNLGDKKWKQIAKDAGLIGRQTVSQGFNELQDIGKLNAKQGNLKKVSGFVQKVQQGSEEASKLTVFKSALEDMAQKAGISVDDAVKNKDMVKKAVDQAEEAIFSPYRISPGERNTIGNIVPFYSFARQAIPFTAKTLAKNPERITKYQKAQNAVEDMSGSEKVPANQRTKTYKNQIQLPGKDKNGKTSFFDPTYIAPWGNIGQENGALPFGLSLNPLATEAFQQIANRNFYFDQPITESNIPRVRAKERVESVMKMIEPAALTNLRTKVAPAVQGKPDQYGKERTVTQSLLDTLFGFKTSKTDLNSMKQSVEKNKAYTLRSLKDEEKKILLDKTMPQSEKNKRILELKSLYGQAK